MTSSSATYSLHAERQAEFLLCAFLMLCTQLCHVDATLYELQNFSLLNCHLRRGVLQ